MASFTKRALRQTILTLLSQLPLDQITVKMIVDACGISRNTFYYHYDDISALLADALDTEFSQYTNECHERQLHRLLAAIADRPAVFAHIDNSQSREILHRRLQAYLESCVRRAMEEDGCGALPAKQRETMVVFFANGIWGLLRAWLVQGAQEPPEELLARLGMIRTMQTGAIAQALQNAAI